MTMGFVRNAKSKKKISKNRCCKRHKLNNIQKKNERKREEKQRDDFITRMNKEFIQGGENA